MQRKIIGPVELAAHEDRLILRYSRRFLVRAAITLLFITAVAAGLLAYPVRATVQGQFLESITIAVFLLIVGTVPLAWAISGWANLVCYGTRPIIFDRSSATSIIPVMFGRRTIRLADIDRVRVERKRVEADAHRNVDASQLWTMHHTDQDAIHLVLNNSNLQPQRLWGRLGLPHAAEPVAQAIADFIGRKLERRPSRYF